MKLNTTNAFNKFGLYLDIIYFSARKYLCKKKSIKIKKSNLINYLVEQSPIIIGQFKTIEISNAVKDIYKQCYRNNRKNREKIKLSRKQLKQYIIIHDINVGGIPWL